MTPRTIPATTITALGELLVRMTRDEPQASEQGAFRAGREVRRALGDLCSDARANQVRVEQLVIAIKQGWTSLHSDKPRARAEGPDEMLNHVIRMCIDEYYTAEEKG